jgi:hypothetical protein
MNDAAKNVEIEDVLASIRRLVSEEVDREVSASEGPEREGGSASEGRGIAPFERAGQVSPTQRPPASPEPSSAENRPVATDAAAPETPAPDAPPDALVLTPALRIDAEADTSEENRGTEAPAEGPVDLGAYIAPSRPDAAEDGAEQADIADAPEASSAEEDQDDLFATRAAVIAAVPDVTRPVEFTARAPERPEAPVPEAAAPAEADARPEERDSAAEATQSAEAEEDALTAHAEASHGDDDAQSVAETEDTMSAPAVDTDVVADSVETDPATGYVVDAETGAATFDATEHSVDGEQAVETPDRSALEDKIARLEALVQQREETFESEEDLGDVTLDWEDADAAEPDRIAAPVDESFALTPEQLASLSPEAAPGATAAPGAGAPAEAGPVPAATGPEMLIDEDMLRALVAALVREELRGALGEKITRNMRNLVRREVHRALASRDLD